MVDLVAAAAGVLVIVLVTCIEVYWVLHIRQDVCTSSNRLLARLAVPDTGRVALDGHLSAERAGVLCVLLNFDLLDLLTERCTISVAGISIRFMERLQASVDCSESARLTSFRIYR